MESTVQSGQLGDLGCSQCHARYQVVRGTSPSTCAVVHGETMVTVRKIDAGTALSNTTNSTTKIVSMFALTFRHLS